VVVWIGFIWIRIVALVKTVMNFRSHKMLGNSSAAERMVAFQGLSSMELVLLVNIYKVNIMYTALSSLPP
jgi:hypothetical protein